MSLADMMMRNYREAAQIKETIELVKPVLFQGVNALGLVINTLEAAEGFSGDMREDLNEAIAETRDLHTRLSVRLEQLLTGLDVLSRAISESTGLTRETKERLGVAAGYLQEGSEIFDDNLNRLANAATLATGLTYLYSDRDYLAKTLAIAEPEVVKEILDGMGWKTTKPEPEEPKQ